MDALADFFPHLLVFAALLLAAIALTPAVESIGLPGPAAFLAVGVIAGYLGGGSDRPPGRATARADRCSRALRDPVPGWSCDRLPAWRREAGPILALGTVGTAATAGLLGIFAHYLLGFDWTLAALVAVALSPTDPAAVYATLRGRDQFRRARVVLEGESGFQRSRFDLADDRSCCVRVLRPRNGHGKCRSSRPGAWSRPRRRRRRCGRPGRAPPGDAAARGGAPVNRSPGHGRA